MGSPQFVTKAEEMVDKVFKNKLESHLHSKVPKIPASCQDELKGKTAIIVGSGFGGIGAAIACKSRGVNVTILERSGDLGGTWRDNNYPGSGCDVPSFGYSFSFFSPRPWSHRYSLQPEILKYLKDALSFFDLEKHIEFNKEVVSATYDKNKLLWEIMCRDGSQYAADTVIFAVGQLSNPNVPAFEGLESFNGVTFHSARWNWDYDLTNKRVGVIGCGASAIQFVPEIVDKVSELVLFQRSPAWVVPRKDRAFSTKTKALLSLPLINRIYRWYVYFSLEARFRAFLSGTKSQELATKLAKAHLKNQVPDEKLREKLKPNFPLGCKRILISDDWYPALCKPNVTIENEPISRFTSNGIVCQDGKNYDLDCVIFGTGFKSTEFLKGIEVYGESGQEIHSQFKNGIRAFYGTMVPGYPNMFLLYGPNVNLAHNSIVFMMECQIRLMIKALRAAKAMDSPVQVKPGSFKRYLNMIDSAMRKTVWVGGCRSWYKNEDGIVTNNWPKSTISFWLETAMLDESVFVGTNVLANDKVSVIN